MGQNVDEYEREVTCGNYGTHKDRGAMEDLRLKIIWYADKIVKPIERLTYNVYDRLADGAAEIKTRVGGLLRRL